MPPADDADPRPEQLLAAAAGLGDPWRDVVPPAGLDPSRARTLARLAREVRLLGCVSLTVLALVAYLTFGASPMVRHYGVKVGTSPKNFQVQGTQIKDPGGNTFVPIGANVNGPGFVWDTPTIGNSGIAQTNWHWNTIRLTTCWVAGQYPSDALWDTIWPGHPTIPSFNGCENGGGNHWATNDNLDGIVSEWTAKQIVVMIDLQHFNPGDPISAGNLPWVQHWWSYIAARYANNPYVWFNPLNEPVGDFTGTLPQWNTITDDLTARIRAAGAKNIVVVDGSNVGQEAGDWKCTADIPYENSALLTYFPALQAKYGGMVGAMHMYNAWGGANQDQFSGCSTNPATFRAQLDTRFNNYLDHIAAANIPLLIGELGSSPPPVPLANWDAGQDAAADTFFRVAPTRTPKLGGLWWHGDDGSGYWLVGPAAGGSCAWDGLGNGVCPSPTLNHFGQLMYDYARVVNP